MVVEWVAQSDGVHFNTRLEEDRRCTLGVIGVRPDGTKELIAVEDGSNSPPSVGVTSERRTSSSPRSPQHLAQ